MRKAAITAIVSVGLLAGAANAQDLRGWCFPADGCMGEISIGSGSYDTCEASCTLTNPVPVRDMEATLYDKVCHGDSMVGGSMTYRIMFIKQLSYQIRMFEISEYSTTELERCKY
jgi:hypothetical protein